MVLRMIGAGIDDLGCRLAMYRIVHLVLHRREELFRLGCLRRVVVSRRVDVGDLLVKMPLACTDFLVLGGESVEILLAEHLAVLQPLFIEDVPLAREGIEHPRGPLAELGGPQRVDAVPDRDNGVQIVVFGSVAFAVGGSCQEILDNCLRVQLAGRENSLQVEADVLLAAIEQRGHGLLGQPHVLILHEHLDTRDAVLQGERQEVDGAVPHRNPFGTIFFHWRTSASAAPTGFAPMPLFYPNRPAT